MLALMDNVQIIRELSDAFNRRDYERCFEIIDPDIEWHPPPDIPNAAVAIGHEALSANFEDWFGAWDDYRSITEEIREGPDDTVVVASRESARGKDSGIELDESWAHVWTARDGLAVQLQVFSDRRRAFAETGADAAALDQG